MSHISAGVITMSKQAKISFGKIALFVVLLFFGGLLDVFGRDRGLQTLSTVYYLLLSVVFVFRISDRVVDPKVRRYLTLSAWMVVFFFLLRGLKYYVFRDLDTVARHLWYFYYVPNLMVPELSLLAALAVDEEAGKRKATGKFFLRMITVLLMGLVLTNDLHQTVFRFQPGFKGWDENYQYGTGYLLIAAWILVLFLAAVAVMVRKCRLSAGKRFFWIPLVPIALGWLYVILYFYDMEPKWDGINLLEFPEAASFVVACFWECCISIGLIPSNKGYEELFSGSSIAAQIADADTGIVYSSDSARELTTEQKVAKENLMLDENTWLHRAEIQGGFVYWQSDISEVNRLNRELEQIEERLSEETELIRLQNELQTQRTELEEKNRVYDRIAGRVLGQSQRITQLTQEAERDLSLYEKKIGWICFYGSYIKRCANLMLLAENNDKLPCGELLLAVSESLRALSECGVSVALSGGGEGELAADCIFGIYECFELIIERAGRGLTGVSAAVTEKGCKLVLEGLDESFEAELKEIQIGRKYEEVACQIEREDDIYYVRLETIL